MTPGDLDILARTVYGEARNQSYQGMKAVAHVVLNRVKKGSPDHTISKAALRHMQFSCFNANDPNFKLVQTVGLDDNLFVCCMNAALEAIRETDFTYGATHYHTKSVSPSWSKGQTPCLVIDQHVFYNSIK